ncbi:hypothetical protein L249_0295 [Ophiocordyceps polyrhachis-furcata BCC 54312]|uniref:DUF3752 domain-containing protein n=1 Tax=Ophiocordyceps polyrhachis-furcata BCC 54312 TaxID=1330021 RepID=A0A367LDP2_9HYPO|nr:hypothetical protein L249_0295 [Ophiocordyceps polyrhachis-furcata BCC 54312]
MPSIGPQLPSHLCKRKRTESPSPPKSPPLETRATRPPNNNANADEIDLDLDLDPNDEDAPAPAAIGPSLPPSTKNTIGPSLPPPPSAPNDNPQPVPEPDSGSSDSDSDFSYGPSLPSSAPRPSIGPSLPPPPEDTAPKRDAWMLAPPPAKTTYTERDPTRLRARKFASKPTPVAPPSSASQPSIWTETPEEKLRRLQDSVLGRSAPDPASQAASRAAGPVAADDQERHIAAAIQAQRGSSLYEEHDKKRRRRGAAAADEEEDDPSKRAFDRDKDMAIGGKVTTAQRRQLVSKSANFGGRFQKGSYL